MTRRVMAAPAPARAEAPVQRLLARLDAVRETAPDRWLARCPAHEDRHPSLSVRELDDGRLLVHCWTGCATSEVLAAVGLSMADLFPRPREHYRAPLPRGQRWVPADVLRAVSHEVLTAQIAAADLARGIALDDERRQRLGTASARLAAAAEAVGA